MHPRQSHRTVKGIAREQLLAVATADCQTSIYAGVVFMQEKIKAGFQTFVSDGSEEFGAVRTVAPGGRPEIVIYVENAGEFTVPLEAVEAVHSEKVILNCAKLDHRLRKAIGHAHDAEKPGL
jgi:hypothetical protein